MAEVTLEHVTKRFPPAVTAVEDLSLTVADGELMVLVGPSGCGKTTMLRLIAGLETPTAGKIYLDKKEVNNWAPRQRNVAMVFQRPALYPHLTVRANLGFGIRLREGVHKWQMLFRRLFRPDSFAAAVQRNRQIDQQVSETARALGLNPFLERRPDQLSGGQQQRVALGRALVRQPGVFLLDEPLSNLEPGFRQEMRRELHLLQRRLRATMVYVTHDQVEALNLGDRVAVMNAGRIQQVDRPGVLYDRPCNRFVAGFIGWPPMNFLDGQVIRDPQGKLYFRVEEEPWFLPLKSRLNFFDSLVGKWVTVGVRPENLKLREPNQEAVDSGLPIMEILLIEPLGTTNLVTLGRGHWRLLALVERREWLSERRTTAVDLEMDRTCWFDRSVGWALGSGDPAG